MNDAPREVRRVAAQARRWTTDWLYGYRWKMIHWSYAATTHAATFPMRISIEQPILPTDYVHAKVHNLRLAIENLSNLAVPPGHIFSFWRLVGRPTRARGFLPGRSLLGGQLRPDFGGGLCQLSGLIYYVSLIAGLEILERHPHSLDIYSEQDRYAPLGADATVAYGFKDLRVLNPYGFPVCFRASVSEETATCGVCAPEPMVEYQVEFARVSERDKLRIVETRRCVPGQAGHEILAVSAYRSPGRQHHTSASCSN